MDKVMHRFNIDLQDVNDFIPKLAAQFKIGYRCKLSEYTLFIPNSLGKGKITAINFYNGLGLYTFQCTFKEEVEMELRNVVINPVRLVHCLNGKVINSHTGLGEEIEIGNHEHYFIAPKSGESHVMTFPANTEVELCYIEIDRIKFKKSLPFKLSEVEPLFYTLFGDVNALQGKYHSGKFSLKVSDIIREVFNCEETGFPRINFLRAKSLEILSYMLSRYRKEKDGDVYQNLSRRDYKAVDRVSEHINQNLKNLETNPQLARMAGMNLNKLQRAFQTIYGQTLNEFIRDGRLSRALSLLSEGEKTISEIVEEIGLNSRSYFSKIFKNKYGVLPREIQKHESSMFLQEGETI
ncbi:helix-turn-helix transcriptional regulator [Salinimicrobium sediminis]|nr:AraC family transcriptional regulator [Salinimicrobium sediminis]